MEFFDFLINFIAIIVIGHIILTIIFTIFRIVVLWTLFQRAGEAGWKSIIPFYGTYNEILIGLGKDKVFLLPILILLQILTWTLDSSSAVFSIATFTVTIITMYIRFKFFNRFAEEGLSVGATLLLPIFGSVIAFGDYPYTPLETDTVDTDTIDNDTINNDDIGR